MLLKSKTKVNLNFIPKKQTASISYLLLTHKQSYYQRGSSSFKPEIADLNIVETIGAFN